MIIRWLMNQSYLEVRSTSWNIWCFTCYSMLTLCNKFSQLLTFVVLNNKENMITLKNVWKYIFTLSKNCPESIQFPYKKNKKHFFKKCLFWFIFFKILIHSREINFWNRKELFENNQNHVCLTFISCDWNSD